MCLVDAESCELASKDIHVRDCLQGVLSACSLRIEHY